jgi:hypothetical protein
MVNIVAQEMSELMTRWHSEGLIAEYPSAEEPRNTASEHLTDEIAARFDG